MNPPSHPTHQWNTQDSGRNRLTQPRADVSEGGAPPTPHGVTARRYSDLSAVTGSTPVARRAGTIAADMPTTTMTASTAPNTVGS